MCLSHRWDVVLCLWGGERHGRHGHHDWLISGVDSGSRSLRARPYGGRVRRDGGPRRLHLSPLEKLTVACEREKREKGQQTLSKPPPHAAVTFSACCHALHKIQTRTVSQMFSPRGHISHNETALVSISS